MKSTDDYMNMLRNYKSTHANDYGIERMGIFGSVARGEQKEGSDVDVCVEMEKPDLFLLIGIKDDLQKLFDCKVDVVRLRSTMNPFLLKRIKQEALYV